MKLKIQLEEEDYVSAALSAAMPTARYIAVTCAVLVGALILAVILGFQGYGREALVGFGTLLGAVVGGVAEQRLMIPRKARKIFHQQDMSAPFELGWNDEEISLVAPNGTFTQPWRHIHKARLLDKQILLFISDANFLMVPKRSFPDAAALSTFETLLGRVTKFA